MKTPRPPVLPSLLWAAATLMLAPPVAAQAQSLRPQTASAPVTAPTAPVSPTPPDAAKADWNIRLGAGAQYQPEYEGSDSYEVSPLPMVMVGYRDLVFLRGPMLGVNAGTWRGPGPNDKLQIGPLVRYQPGRDQDDSDDLDGMGDIDGGAEIGAFVTYATGPWSAGLTLFHDASGSHDGLTAKLSAGHRMPLMPKLMLRSEISATWADDNYTETFFGVTALQSTRSGMREYRPEGGLKDAAVTVDLDYSLTEHWGVTGRLGYKRLVGDAADSPLVKDRGTADQLSTGMFVTYKF